MWVMMFCYTAICAASVKRHGQEAAYSSGLTCSNSGQAASYWHENPNLPRKTLPHRRHATYDTLRLCNHRQRWIHYSGDVLDAINAQAAAKEEPIHAWPEAAGIHETGKLFSLNIEPEKEIVFTLVPRTIVNVFCRPSSKKTAAQNEPRQKHCLYD